METKTYASPQVEVLEVSAEGVFCISGQNEQFEREEFVW